MADTLPPEVDDDIGAQPDCPKTASPSRWQKVVGVLGLFVILWVGRALSQVVFFDGFGPGAGGGTPAVDQPPGPAVDQGPGGGNVHTPGPPAGGH